MPNVKSKKRQKTGNERRGNANAQSQVRENLKQTAKTVTEKITQSRTETSGSSSYKGSGSSSRGSSTTQTTSANRNGRRGTGATSSISRTLAGRTTDRTRDIKTTAERMQDRRDKVRSTSTFTGGRRYEGTNALRDRLKESKQGEIIKGAAQQQVGGYEKFFGNLVSQSKPTGKSGAINRKLGGSSNTRRNDRLRPDQKIGTNNENASTIAQIQQNRQKAGEELADRGAKNIQEGSDTIQKIKDANESLVMDENGKLVPKKGGKFKNWMLDLEVAGLQMGGDALIGAATGGLGSIPSMFARAGGTSMYEAEQQGASREDATKYGLAIGGVEALTEKIGAAASPLKKVYGAGAADSLMEKVIGKMAAKSVGGEITQRTFMAALSEGLEEMIAEGVEPTVANVIYADAIAATNRDSVYQDAISKGYSEKEAKKYADEAYNAVHQSTSFADIMRAGSLGAALGGLLGGAGNVIETAQGQNLKQIYGKDGIKAMAKRAKNVNDSADAARATAIYEQIENGEDVTPGQVNAVFNAVQKQEAEDSRSVKRYNESISLEMNRNRYESPVVQDEEGNAVFNRVTSDKFQAISTEAREAAGSLTRSEEDAGEIGDAVAAVMTGIAGSQEVSLFTNSNPEARAVLESVAGVELPKSNAQMREYLFALSARNYVETAKEETDYLHDQIRGVLNIDMAQDYGSNGQSAFSEVMADEAIDPRDNAKVEAAAVFEDYYRAGVLGIPIEQIRQNGNPNHSLLTIEQQNAAYEAGNRDGQGAMSIPEGSIVSANNRLSNARNGRPTGILYVELSDEMKPMFTGSQQKMYRELARRLHINIHIVDDIEGANGYYRNGEVYLSMNNDRGLELVFGHEVTHLIKAQSKEAYDRLEQLVRERWEERGGIEEAIKDKQNQYKEAVGQNLSEDEALEEIIADATYEMFGDPQFVQKICAEERSLGKAIVYAIRTLLANIRAILADGGYTPSQNAQLLSQLDILSEFEDLWLQGLRDAARAEVTKETKVTKLSAKDKSNNSIKQQISNHRDDIIKRGVIATADVTNPMGKRDSEIASDIANEYRKFGSGVDRKGFGFISLDEKLINASLDYLNTEGEYAAFKVLPKVLKRGLDITDRENHKGRGYDTVTFAGLVEINGKPGIVAAVVKKTKGNRYKTHRIVAPDGSSYVFENKKTEATTGSMTNNAAGEGLPITSAEDNVPQTEPEVKERKSVREDDFVRISPERMDSIIEEYAIPRNENSNYSKAWIATINPRDFLTLTVSDEVLETWELGTENEWGQKVRELDEENLRRSRMMPRLTIDSRDSHSVIGHEGRHRMLALMRSGYTEVPVVVRDLSEANKTTKESMDEMDLWSEDFGSGPVNSDDEVGTSVEVYDVIPINEKNRSEIERIYGGEEGARFSAKEPVEQVRDLIAVHNLSEDKLKKVLALGGFPMPSIAVTNQNHENFGDISLLFGSETIDPKRDRNNKVYSADAWTPTVPETETKYNEKVLKNIRTKLEDILGLKPYQQTIMDNLKIPSLDESNVEHALKYSDPYEAYGKNEALKLAYLKSEKNFDVAIPTKPGQLQGYGENFWEHIDDAIPEMTRSEAYNMSYDEAMEYEPAIRKALQDEFKNKLGEKSRALKKTPYSEQLAWGKVTNFLADLVTYRENGGVPSATDMEALNKILSEKVDEEGYKKWIDNLFEGVVEKTGIRNSKDLFTPSGNRRSWESLHDPATVENIVRAMKAQGEKNISMVNAVKTLRADTAKTFKSLDEIRKNKTKLQDLSEEKVQEIYNELDSKYSEILDNIIESNPGKNKDNMFFAYDEAAETMSECAQAGIRTADGIVKKYKQYQWNVSEETANDILQLFDAIENMPVNMFEAKPRRAVGFDEVKAAIVPESTPEEVKNQLSELGISVSEYNPQNEGERAEKVNLAADEQGIRFSVRDNLGDDLQKVLDGTFPANDEVLIGDTSDFLVDVMDANPYKVTMPSSKAYRAMVNEGQAKKDGRYKPVQDKEDHYHNLGKSGLIEALVASENPVIAFASKEDFSIKDKGHGRIVLVTDKTDEDGNYIVVVQRVDSKGQVNRQRLLSNKIITTYGKDYIEGQIIDANADNRILFADKKRSHLVSGGPELQSFRRRNFDFTDNIDDFWANVNYEKSMGRYSLPEDNPPTEEDVIDYINMDEVLSQFDYDGSPYAEAGKNVRFKSYDELKAKVEKLEKDKRLTHGRVLDTKPIREDIVNLLRTMAGIAETAGNPVLGLEGRMSKTNAKLVNDTVKNATKIYKMMKNGHADEAVISAMNVADDIIERIQVIDDSTYDEYKQLKRYLRSTPITISEEDASSIPDFKDFKRDLRGKVRIVKEGGLPVDSVYEELVELFPGVFDEEITHPADQLIAIAEAREAFEPYDVMYTAEEREQLLKDTTAELLDIIAEGQPWRSWADKKSEMYQTKVKMLQERHREAKRELRIRERERADRLVREEREKGKQRLQKEKERSARKEAELKQKTKDQKAKAKDAKQRAKQFGHIEKNYKWLSDRLIKPSDDKHIPEEYKICVAGLLMTLDLQTERSKALEEKTGRKAQKTFKFEQLRAQYEKLVADHIIEEDETITDMLHYDSTVDLLEQSLATKLEGKSVDALDTQTMGEIDILLKAIVGNIKNANKAFAADREITIDQMADAVFNDCSKVIERSGTFSERKKTLKRYFLETSKVINVGMKKPREFFEHLGKGMSDAYMEIRRGEDKHFRNMQFLRGQFEQIFRSYNNKKKPGSAIEKWRDTTQLQSFELENGETIKLNPSQIMSLYCLNKREQAQGHIYGSGIVPSKVDGISGKIIHRKHEVEGGKVMVTRGDVQKIIDTLTDEQKKMADQLQSLLNNEVAAWGNETSMLMYNYEKFTEKNYFPIKSHKAYLDSSFEGRTAEERIRNFGFTKGTITHANNPIVIADIFEVVADHCNKMSLYNSFAAPLSDFTRMYNTKIKNEDGTIDASVEDAIVKAYGKDTKDYIHNLMADINNNTQIRPDETRAVVNKFLANYKRATIGLNMRVAVQQPTAIVRAFDVISPKYFAGDTHVLPHQIKRDIDEMCNHCPIALWKSWGHNDVDMARDVDDIMMNKAWSRFDILTMGTYGALDIITWSKIWNAVKREVKAKNPKVEVGSDEYWELCNDRASEVFDKTQVVDSVLHRSQTMRSKDTMTKMISSFMAEPTTTFNMLQSDIAEARDLWAEGQKGKAFGKLNRCMTVFMMNAAAVSAAAAVVDLLRNKTPGDDDDDKEGFLLWYANFLNNFGDNANPIKMIPYASQVYELFTGDWGTSNMAFEGWESLAKGMKELEKFIKGDSKKEPEAVMWMVADGIGNVLGIPVKSFDKDFHAIQERFGAAFAAEQGSEDKIRTKDENGNIYELYPEKPSLSEKFFGWMNVEDGSKLDNFLNKWGLNLTEEEKQQREFNEKKDEILKKCEGLEGDERSDKLWKLITNAHGDDEPGLTKLCERADYDSIASMRKMLKACGGDTEKFDDTVLKKSKTNFKKTIGVDIDDDQWNKQDRIYQYMSEHGMSEEDISELVYQSDTAKEFKKAYVLQDEDGIVGTLKGLREAGITYEDYVKLCDNASRSVKASEYATGEFDNPVNGVVTSNFGHRSSPGGIGSTNHMGLDIGAPSGTRVNASDGGKVISAGWNGGYGYCVQVDHGNGYVTLYGHLSGYEVQKGQVVKKGQQIGKVGSTGKSTGPHLHFGVQQNGNWVDPKKYTTY